MTGQVLYPRPVCIDSSSIYGFSLRKSFSEQRGIDMTGCAAHLGVVVAGLAITALSAINADAGQVTVNFTGTVMQADASSFPGAAAGDSFSGTFVYDSSQPIDPPGTENPGVYTFLPPLASGLGMSVTIGGVTYAAETSDLMQIQIANDVGGATPDAFVATAFINVGGVAKRVDFGLGDSTGTVFSSTALPTSLDLSKFDSGVFEVLGATGSPHLFDGTINVGLASVPEPSSGMLLGLGVLGAGVWSLRRRRSRLR